MSTDWLTISTNFFSSMETKSQPPKQTNKKKETNNEITLDRHSCRWVFMYDLTTVRHDHTIYERVGGGR